jgi:hypothetical protein
MATQFFYQSSSSTASLHSSFSFGGADGDNGRLKLTPGAAPQGEAKDHGSIDLTDLLCRPFLSMDNEDCDDMQYGLPFGVPPNSNFSINFISMSSWADAHIAQVNAKGGGCTDLTDLLFGPLLLMDDDACDEQKCSSFCYGANINDSKFNLNAVNIGCALHFGRVVVNCGNGKDHTPALNFSTMTLRVKVIIGGVPVLPYF